MKTEKIEIIINGVKHLLDVDRAKELGVLSQPLPERLSAGDVFVHPTGRINSFLLVQAVYGNVNSFTLLGIGCSPNSNHFHTTLHSIDEIRKYLEENKMVFSKNVNSEIRSLVKN
jgi:hypothetical protein